MSNSWAQNPLNKRDAYAQHALPQLLFRQCHLNCVDSDVFSAEKPSEVACIQNCQEKTYQAFDMFMQIKVRQEAQKSVRDFVDISAFTEMEVEHGHDTASQLPMKRGTHLIQENLQKFQRMNERANGQLRQQASAL